MEYLIFWAAVLCFVIAVISMDIVNDLKKQKQFERDLRENYGNLKKKDVSPERFLRIDKYFQKHREEGQIDDVTWFDLGMDEIYKLINVTNSASGEEYLYYALRSAGRSKAWLDNFENVVEYFRTHEEERICVQLLASKLGYVGKYSIYDYLDNLDYLGERSNKKHLIADAILIACFGLIPFQAGYAVLAIVGMMIFNVISYFKEKDEIEPYIVSFKYVLKLLSAGQGFARFPGKKELIFREDAERLQALNKHLSNLQKGSFWVVSGHGSLGGNPADLLIDYLKMTFHLDLIRFNQMLKFLRQNVSEVDELNTIIGKWETAIAVGSFRTGLERENGYCVPELNESKPRGIQMLEGYHPLLSKPVKNSIEAERGILLTGSNASGKSTFLKTVAINAILAQTIHTCTAKSFSAPYYRIFSSMALKDDVEVGDSYYIVEIKTLKRILNATEESGRPVACFVDEVLRGTNTVERIAASTQVLISLARENVFCCAATHDIELTELLKQQYDNYHFEEEIIDGDVCFQYKLLKGKATTRNAIRLLEIIGYDGEIVEKAQKMAEGFLKDGVWNA